MVRGVFFKFNFATRGVTADLLFPIVWQAIYEIEAIGLKVIFVTADGASCNRKFFRMHKGPHDTELVYKTINHHSGQQKLLFFPRPTQFNQNH